MPNEIVEQKIIQVSFWKAATILASAVLVSIVGTAFTVARVINSDHFLLARTVDDVAELKTGKLDVAIYEIQQQQITKDLEEIKRMIREL